MLLYLLISCFIANSYALPHLNGMSQRIVGGDEVDISEIPYQVALLYDWTSSDVYRLKCGGSIISSNIVLTAAFCVDGSQANQWLVRAGSNLTSGGGQTVLVDRFIMHPNYTNRLDYDIALMILSEPLIIDNDKIAEARLPDQNMAVEDGVEAIASGWGAIVEGGASVDELQMVTIPVVNREVCANIYASINIVTDRMICAGRIDTGGQDACQGDSGGPLTVDGVLIGISSWGRGCGRPGFPGVWASVPVVRDWIDSEIESLH